MVMKKRAVPSKKSAAVSRTETSLLEMGGVLVLALAIGYLFHRFHILHVEQQLQGVIGLGTVFLVGLTAAFSTCLAVVGGLLLSLSATWNDMKRSASRAERFEPLFLFNVGRLAGYFLLGGVVGVIGKAITLSPFLNGILTIVIALVMIILGLRILRILPSKYCTVPFTGPWTKRLRSLAKSRHPVAPFILGGLTFFVPCGFTQSMQLLALGSGSFLAGGSIMFTFALGTLPSLLGISFLGAFTTGKPARLFSQCSAVLVLLFGVLNLQSGFALMNIDIAEHIRAALLHNRSQQVSQNVSVNERGQQIISLNVTDAGFTPNVMTIEPNKETWIYANAPNGISGCASSIMAPSYGISTVIRQGFNWLGPIKNPASDFLITCSTGVLRATIHIGQKS